MRKFNCFVLPAVVWAVVAIVSYEWNSHLVKERIFNQATDRAQFVFKMVESARLWNARHGGIYAPISELATPNPYLKVKQRDINSSEGMELTMINPAYMTRQLIDVVAELTDLRLHLTSLKLLNPSNKPDSWERKQLENFEKGVSAFSEFKGKTFRYMAPLRIDSTCLKCHAHQNYKIGDIRGGVSVSFSAEPLYALENNLMRSIGAIHIVVWGLLTLLTTLFIHRSQKNIANLQREKERVERVVEERTKDLKKLTYAIEFSPASIVITDSNGVIEYVNPKFCEITGYSKEEAVGKNPNILQSGKVATKIYEDMWQTILEKKEWQGELLNRTKDGKEYWESARISPILDDLGEITHFVAVKEDISEKKLEEAKIYHQATHDPLTQLANRKKFEEVLAHSLEGGVALMYLDLDGFKPVNDTLGHEAGDKILIEVAKRLKKATRSSDLVARVGGDEFVIVLTNSVDKDGVALVASKIVDLIGEPFVVGSESINISVSIGIVFSDKSSVAKDLVKEADKAMYEAKEAGRGRFVFGGSR